MEILERKGYSRIWRPPNSAVEYFTVLYCERRNICRFQSAETKEAWASLSAAEQKVFIDKFEKWQAENYEKITSILEHAEPFLKKKATKEKDNVKSHKNTTKEECDTNHKGSTVNLSTNPHDDNMSNANFEDNLNSELFMDEDDQSESMMNLVYDDDTSIVNSDVPQRVYAASVIDTDIDESVVQEKMNEKTNAALPEPTLVVVTARELFEAFKISGKRPELVTQEWKDLSRNEKATYNRAVRKIRKEYLIQYEKYLESLPSPELFKHYIKFKRENV